MLNVKKKKEQYKISQITTTRIFSKNLRGLHSVMSTRLIFNLDHGKNSLVRPQRKCWHELSLHQKNRAKPSAQMIFFM